MSRARIRSGASGRASAEENIRIIVAGCRCVATVCRRQQLQILPYLPESARCIPHLKPLRQE
jgi:hypothetical protein